MKDTMFSILFKQKPELVDQVGKLFDSDQKTPAGDNQPKLAVLAAMLCQLEKHPDDGSDLSMPFLRFLRALETAYHIGASR